MTEIAPGIYTDLDPAQVAEIVTPAWDGLPYWNDIEEKWEL